MFRRAPEIPGWFLWSGPLLLVLLIAAQFVDADLVNIFDRQASGIEGRDWHRFLRVMGSITVWALLAAVYICIDLRRSGRSVFALGQWDPPSAEAARVPRESHRLMRRFRAGLASPFERGGFVLASAVLSGLGAELVKLLFRRGRPDTLWLASGRTLNPADPLTSAYHFFWPVHSFKEFFASSELGMASSHAATAFGGMLALSLLHRRTWPVFLTFAALAAWTRLQVRDHYLSDVIGGALVAWVVVAAILWITTRRDETRR
ncbi:hypothetical protein BH11PLA1_BH11PLA1_10150 [soil metagenome]